MNQGGVAESGFAAGTLVQTRDGLKPIEEIKVGDWVHSQPEDRGEVAYKRVVKTFCFEDKPVVRVKYGLYRDGKQIGSENFIVTGNHPFWVAGKEHSWFPEDHPWESIESNFGWTRADSLRYGDVLQLSSGDLAVVSSSEIEKLWRTEQADVAWEAQLGAESGYLVTIQDTGHVVEHTDLVLNHYFRQNDISVDHTDEDEFIENLYYRRTVHNFEVEDFHTYYVGNFGVWVGA